MRMRQVLRAFGSAVWLMSSAAYGMQVEGQMVDASHSVVVATGSIETGDEARILAALRALPAASLFVGLFVSSTGGNVLEAESIASSIHSGGVTVVVPAGGVCASACFLLFAASPKRVVARDALIGVHSASSAAGAETASSLTTTTLFARDLAAYKVPPAIIGRLVSTPPDGIWWLRTGDLADMGVTFLAKEDDAPMSPPAPSDRGVGANSGSQIDWRNRNWTAPAPAVREPSGAVAMVSPPIQHSPSFDRGRADRLAWEQWFNSLTGRMHDGAQFWSAQRSLRKPQPCFGPGAPFLEPDWTEGCVAAQQRLAPSDVQRHQDPEYKAGWNSL